MEKGTLWRKLIYEKYRGKLKSWFPREGVEKSTAGKSGFKITVSGYVTASVI